MARSLPLGKLKPIFEDRALIQPYLRELRQQRTLRIRLDDDRGVELVVEFHAFLAYRQRDESFALRTNEYMRAESANHWVYETEDSEFLDWFKDETHGAFADPKPLHFVIATSNEYVDVIAVKAPTIEGC
jgi:hypothetical protein